MKEKKEIQHLLHQLNAYPVNGVMTKVYTKYLTGVLDADATTNILHNIADHDKIIECAVLTGMTADRYKIYEILEGASGVNASSGILTATEVIVANVGANIQSKNYRIKIDYYL